MYTRSLRWLVLTVFYFYFKHTNSSPLSKEALNEDNNQNLHEEKSGYFKRLAAVQSLQDPYPHKFNVTRSFQEFTEVYGSIRNGDALENVTVSIAGRILSISKSEEGIVWDLTAEGVNIQILLPKQSERKTSTDPVMLQRGDVIGCTGHPSKTNAGELSIIAKDIKLLAPSLHTLPHLLDSETKSRRRYLDLILNEKARQTFSTRAKIISYIRQFLNNLGFLEVETPILNKVPGGALAKPFLTHHAEMGDLYLRISPELFLKQLVVGGLERVYEIGKQFRNEEIDTTHNPEFTTCEFYMAYADVNDLMTISETLLSGLVKSIHGSYKIKYHVGPEREEKEIDFTPPFRRVSMMSTLEQVLNVTLPPATELDTPEANVQLTQIFETRGVPFPEQRSNAKLLEKLVNLFIELTFFNPTFIVDHPEILSPLAKGHRNYPGLTERFELYAMQKEIGNAYTEQNDPVAQRARLEEEAVSRAAGDEEIPPTDEEFLTALEYGLPPTAGLGIGIDRLVMLLTDNVYIQDVLLFPAVKPNGMQ